MEGRTEGVIICRSCRGYIPAMLRCASLYRVAILPKKQPWRLKDVLLPGIFATRFYHDCWAETIEGNWTTLNRLVSRASSN
ncbi:hypothetical protein SZ54_2532 [Rhizobium sp. UR51a]|nr:hypothetical protein SZ54_2532 [Rhizobium sp. UR51a]